MPTARTHGRRLPASVLALACGLFLGCSSMQGARHYSAGNDALAAGDAGHAVHHFEEAARLVPHASEIQNHLGLAYQAAGRRDDALAAYERAVDLDCDNAAAQHNLDALRRHLGLAAHESGDE